MRSLLFAAIILFSFGIVKSQDHTPRLELTPSVGYQFTSLDWSIAGNTNGQSPNVLSELRWRKLSGPSFNARLQLNLTKRLFIAGNLAICQVSSGTATDIDYAEDDRRQPTYNAQFDSDEGHTNAYRFYGGYNLLVNKKFGLSAFAGYAINKEFLLLLKHDEYVPGRKTFAPLTTPAGRAFQEDYPAFTRLYPGYRYVGSCNTAR